MGFKKTRILKKEWSDFIAKFNAENRYRFCDIFSGDEKLIGNIPFAGMIYDEQERTISVITGTNNPERPCMRTETVEVPRGIFTIPHEDTGHLAGIQIQRKPGIPMLKVLLHGDVDAGRHEWIKQIAHTIYERRNEADGSAESDWIQAEKVVEDVITDLSACH
jgi:hypothetical protein